MKIVLMQRVKIEGDPYPHSWKKKYESVAIPNVGNFVEDPLWKDPCEYEVEEITFNYDANECYVSLKPYGIEIPKNREDEIAHMANLHGWKVSWAIS